MSQSKKELDSDATIKKYKKLKEREPISRARLRKTQSLEPEYE